MGCRFELVLAGGPERWLRAAGEEAIEEIETTHALLTRFERGSVVSRINEGSPQRIDAELFALFELADQIRQQSNGAFDSTQNANSKLLLHQPSRTVSVSQGGSIDLGGIGKGYAIDLAIRSLRDAGITSAFVHAGGSSGATIGTRPDGSPWRISIGENTPLNPLRIDITARAFAVSGDAQQGQHITDPRTMSTTTAGAFGACVGVSACECDAWATALCVLGARPAAMPESLHSFLPAKSAWRIEPDGRLTPEDHAPCAQSTAVRL
jgi:thiamine biosynthesis lipoprotein